MKMALIFLGIIFGSLIVIGLISSMIDEIGWYNRLAPAEKMAKRAELRKDWTKLGVFCVGLVVVAFLMRNLNSWLVS